MSGQTKTLIAIAAFVAFCFGSFVWYMTKELNRQGAASNVDLISFVEVA